MEHDWSKYIFLDQLGFNFQGGFGSLRPALMSGMSVQQYIAAAGKKSDYHDGDATLRVSHPEFFVLHSEASLNENKLHRHSFVK